MKYLLVIFISLLLAFISIQIKLKNLTEHSLAPLPSISLNVLPNSITTYEFVVPLDAVNYDVSLVINRSTQNRNLECEFAMSGLINRCSNTRTSVDLDLTILENNKILNLIEIRGGNQASWWGNTLGSNLTRFQAKKHSQYKMIVQLRSSLEKFKELNPKIQVALDSRLAKKAFVKASIFSAISNVLMLGIFVSLLSALILYYKKRRQK